MKQNVFLYHLDKMKGKSWYSKLISFLLLLTQTSKYSIFLFKSPKIPTSHEPMMTILEGLFKKNLLKLLYYDKIHLFHHFGDSFCNECLALKNALTVEVPRILVMATCMQTILQSICEILDVSIKNYY